MIRTTVMLPESLKNRAQQEAREMGISLGELIRQSVALRLEAGPHPAGDPLFTDVPVYNGPVPADYSREHDRYLYGERD